ncbi:MAG: 4Fe-4S binding protein [Anaerolinea sp.]|nr:4Fe-4S binding protein [Anaerolinea sp.]
MTAATARRSRPRTLDLRPALVGWILVFALGSLVWRDALPTFIVIDLIVSVALAIALYVIAPRKQRNTIRRLIIFLMGSVLFSVAVFSGRGNMQPEGLYFGILITVTHPAVIHYALAKIVGPLFFGRVWCGWACWFAALFDQLPFKRSRGRLRGRWGWLRYGHFALSLGLVLLFWFGYDYHDGANGVTGLMWFLIGAGLYVLTGVLLAFILKDNRAFCKYFCPINVPLKLSSSRSLLRLEGDPAKCNDCHACVVVCPMDVQIPQYIADKQRVLSTECTMCISCINVCPKDALKLSFGWDTGAERLRSRKPQTNLDWLRGLKFRRLLPGKHDLSNLP